MTNEMITDLAAETKRQVQVLQRKREDRKGAGRTLADRDELDRQIRILKDTWWAAVKPVMQTWWLKGHEAHNHASKEHLHRLNKETPTND